MLFVPITLVSSLLVAAALNRRLRGISLYRLAVFVPVVTSTVATGVIFSWLLDPDYGIVNARPATSSGCPQLGFFASPDLALYTMVAMTAWGWIGFGALIFLAGLQSIPQDLLEAAQIDGCSRTERSGSIQVPLLRPVIGFMLVWLTINALQLFDEVYVTTKGGPLHSTTVVVYYLYQQAFQYFHAGYAAAIACLLFVAIALITVVQMRLSRDPDLAGGSLMARGFRLRAPSPWHLVLVPLALVMLIPLIWMLITSLSSLEETRRFPPGLPSSLHWESYAQAWTDSPLAHWLLNSTLVSVTCVLSNLVLCSLAGYAFARISFAGSRILFLAILATLMVPFQVVMIPTLLIVKQLGLVDSLPALILPNLVTPFGIYLPAPVLPDAARSSSRRPRSSTVPDGCGSCSASCCR